jgi:hypothetical protein
MRKQEGSSQICICRLFQPCPIHVDQLHQERTLCNLARTVGGIGSNALDQGYSHRQMPPEPVTQELAFNLQAGPSLAHFGRQRL